MTQEQITQLPENKKYDVVESLGLGNSASFLVREYDFSQHVVQIIKAQWTKTQKTYCIRVLNVSTGKRPHCQIPNYTLRNAKACVKEAIETGIVHLWTGHTFEVGNLIKKSA